MSIESIIEGVIEREGAYSDHPADRGGPTAYGITEATARRNGYTGSMRDFHRAMASRIYLREYVQDPGFDKVAAINSAIAEEMVDTGVNCGTSLPGAWLQRTLNLLNREGKLFPDLVVDGKIGPATLSALRSVLQQRGKDGEKVILRALNCLQGARYFEITERRPANEAFFYGWLLNRVEVA